MSKPKKPKQPNASKVGNEQFHLGKRAATWSQGLNAVPMNIPGQSISYVKGKHGRVKGVNVNYDPANQAYFDAASANRNQFLNALPDSSFAQPDETQVAAVRKAYYDKGLAEIEPDLKRAEDANKLQLTERGIPIGSEVYGNENERLAQDRSNTLTTLSQNADLAAGQESDRQLAQALTVRNQPFNEYASMISAAPMQPVSYPQMSGYSVSAPDISTPQYNAYNQQMQDYNANKGGLWNGLLGLGKTAVGALSPIKFGSLGGR